MCCFCGTEDAPFETTLKVRNGLKRADLVEEGGWGGGSSAMCSFACKFDGKGLRKGGTS